MKKTSSHNPGLDPASLFEQTLGCKWTLHVLGEIRRGVHRPSELARTAEGLTTKVLNERLNKLLRFGVLERHAFPEVPPRVEYRLSPLGRRFIGVLDAIEALRDQLAAEADGADAEPVAAAPRA